MEGALHDGLVAIRPFGADDAVSLFEAACESMEELCEWMVWCHPGYSRENSLDFVSRCEAEWRAGNQYSFGIFEYRTGTLLGSVGLNSIHQAHKVANLGYWVRTSRTRRGVATAATRLLARFALEQLRLNRLEIVVPTGNKASLRVAQKAGASLEGILRHRLILNGKPHDAMLYSIIPGDLDPSGRNLPGV